jgi:acyl-CoA reductase-like NAD-dependent aldehyde dehydrogenase
MTETLLINPATEEQIGTVASTSAAETDVLIERAATAFPAWRDTAPGKRARLLHGFGVLVRDRIEELARLEVINSGHTIGNARWEAGNVADVLTYYAGSPERLLGKQIPVPGGIDLVDHGGLC